MKRILLATVAFAFFIIACKKDKKEGTIAELSTNSITNLSDSAAQTGGTIIDDGGAPITKSGVCYALHANPTVGDSITNNGIVGGAFTSQLTKLAANTIYYVKAYAINSAGTAYGNELSFTTSAGLATLTTTAITDGTTAAPKSGGTITNDGGSPITARGIVYGTSHNPTITDFKSIDGTGTGTFTSTVATLTTEGVYYVRAYATNSSGTAYGNELSFTSGTTNSVVDIDGNIYPTVLIGSQIWMQANLKTSKYRNGDPITNGLTGFVWSTATTGAYSFPNGDAANNDTYGKYYNALAVLDSRGICPTGWHVPTQNDWETLEFNQGMSATDTARDGYRSTNTTLAAKLKEGGSSGLNLQLAGYLFDGDGLYYDFGNIGYFYSSTISNPTIGSLFARAIFGSGGGWATYQPFFRREYNTYVESIRCIKD